MPLPQSRIIAREVHTLKVKPNPPKQATLEKTDAGWKIVHMHRATGQKPESASG
jgi:hypothetical protein